MSLLDQIVEKLQDEEPESVIAVVRERLAFVELREKALLQKIEDLQREAADAKRENADLKAVRAHATTRT
ncbi:MAG: hypothetical protein QOE70_4328 [Chthoniobacter sp.]|jgi:hypothetical protein|nr:hypothetical protein [Chthoniobacter sp.]